MSPPRRLAPRCLRIMFALCASGALAETLPWLSPTPRASTAQAASPQSPSLLLVELNLSNCLTLGELWRARSRLYRSRFLQANTRWKSFDEIYQIYIPFHLSDLNQSTNLHRECWWFVHLFFRATGWRVSPKRPRLLGRHKFSSKVTNMLQLLHVVKFDQRLWEYHRFYEVQI